MELWQAIIIALFVYLGAIGSVVGNTFGWYMLGRPIVAAFIVGIIMSDVPTAMALGLLLQLANLGSVTPGGAVGWDLSYATYIGVAGALTFHTGDLANTTALMWAFSTVGGAIGVAMWNLSYALNLAVTRAATKAADEADAKKIAFANAGLGNMIGFLTRFVPALVILYTTAVVGAQSGVNIAELMPNWLIITLTTFGGMMAALGIGILMSYLIKESWQFVLFIFGFMLVGNFKLDMMGITVFGLILVVLYYIVSSRNKGDVNQ